MLPRAASSLLAAGLVGGSAHAEPLRVDLAAAGPDARVEVHAARFLRVEPPGGPGEWWVELRLAGTGAAMVLLPAAGRPAPDPAVTDALGHATAPRFVERPARDPCLFGVTGYGRVVPPTAERPWPHGPSTWNARWPKRRPVRAEVKRSVRRFGSLSSLEAFLAASGAHLDGPAMGRVLGRPVQVVRGPVTEAPTWWPPSRLPGEGRDLDLSSLLERAPPGRTPRFDVLAATRGLGLAPSRGARLPSGVALPEVSFEHPRDTERAAVRHAQRSEGGRPVQTYAAARVRLSAPVRAALGFAEDDPVTLTRHAFEGAPGGPRLRLAPTPIEEPLEPLWWIHRVWRAPIACAERQPYLFAVAKQQAAAHRLYATLTGRPRSAVIALSRQRAYLLEPFGQPAEASTGEAPRSVEVDRRRW